jgi:hypothetical protein
MLMQLETQTDLILKILRHLEGVSNLRPGA